MNEIKLEWVDKYAPKTLDDYVLDPKTKKQFKAIVKSNSLTSMTFAGIAGSGKTTLAKILCNEFDADVLFVKCATEGVVDTLRAKIEPFCNAMSMEGKLKIVLLDELDSASSSGANNFQMALRTLIEAAQSDTRFIATCNMPEKVLPAILSRCPITPLKFDKKDLLIHLKKILDSEKVKYDKDGLKAFIEATFKHYPDCRRIVKYLQMCSNSGTLKVNVDMLSNAIDEDVVKSVVDQATSANNLLDVRKFYLQHKDKCGDFIGIASAVFSYVADNDIVNADGILKLTDLIYQLNVVVDREPTFFGMLTAIRKYKN